MASSCAVQAVVPTAQLGASTSERCKTKVVSQSVFLGTNTKKSALAVLGASQGKHRVVCEVQKVADRWAGLGNDISDDQQDITRGKGLVDSLFQGAAGFGTQDAVLSSWDYISQGQRTYQWDNMKDGYYIAPAFMDKIVVHLAKNFMDLPNIKVPLILGVWGGKGQGKSFQAELIFSKLGINPIVMSAGELESGNAGEPAKLIRQRYREASDIIKKGKMCCLFINDLDAGAGRMGGTTQYTVNNQMVNATLMNIADNPTNVQLPGVYNKEDIPRVPVIVTGNDFSTLYAPLIRDGRMEKFYWAPTRDDRVGVCVGIFRTDGVSESDVEKLVDTFPGQSIDFFGALRARVYDDEVRKWVGDVGVENIGKKLVNSKDGPPTFEKPPMTLEKLLEYGNMLVQEQENVKRVQLADKYLEGAELGNANEDFRTAPPKAAKPAPTPAPARRADPTPTSYAPPAPTPSYEPPSRSGNGSYMAVPAPIEEIIPIIPRDPSSLPGRGMRGRRRGPAVRTSRPTGENGAYSSGSESEPEGYYSDSTYSSYSAPAEIFPAPTEEIIPILPKNPGALPGRRGRKRGLARSPKARGENGAYSSESGSESEGYYSDSVYSSYSTPAQTEEIVPIIAKSKPVRGRGILSKKRGVRRPRADGSYSSGSESESESYFSDSGYSSFDTAASTQEIVPIIAKSKPVRGRGILSKKRGARRPRADGSYSSGAESGSESYFSDSGYSSSQEIVPIIAKSKPVRGRGILSKKRGVRRPRADGSYSSGSESESESYFSDSSYSSFDTTASTQEIVPIIAKSKPVRGRGILSKKRGVRRPRADGSYSSGSESESEGYYSDSTYSSYSAPAQTEEIVPIIAKSKPVRGRGILSKKRVVRRPRADGSYSSGSEASYSSGSDSESEGYYSDSVYSSSSFETPSYEPVATITPIYAKPTAVRGGRGRGRGRR